ncbi:MAG: AMP-dependent synthetase [Betaproteobacteria bacterium RIFCSPHIGHO2_12_FULL_69_13]|nr:MAG: AMP-dependent synthetase [Betaproteobacteria bacterium RIFCSPHIGHO2_12_FULL_69_13]OGA65709.1 MAG: AMP-dependent synthetase [Betaproteobacteria bacterium RIFCSPLOWO2_12_FULL_68_20]
MSRPDASGNVDLTPIFYDALEPRSREEREAALMAALAQQIAHAKKAAPGFAQILAEVDSEAVSSRQALARLPVTRKSDLAELQKRMPPLGGLNATPVEKLAKIFVSPGPIYDPEGRGSDWWRTARGLYAGGFRAGDLIANTFAYHFTPAGSMLESGALALGCTVLPAGIGQTEMQVAAIRDLGVNGYIGTPSFLKLIVEKADELKADISCLVKAQVGAEYLPPALRKAMGERGIGVTQMYASADLGLIAYESVMPDGSVNEGMILDEGLILEIVRPGTGDPVSAGEVGEVVITTLNRDYPLIRFGTGDLSAVLPGTSPCGRTNVRIKGWMGRADQSTKVRAMFVTPKQVSEVVRRHPEIARARLVVEGEAGSDRMTLKCEVKDRPAGLAEAIVASIRDVTKLRGEVELVAPGGLPNDGKVIEDLRKYG